MKTTLLMLALVLLSGHAVGSGAQVNLVADPGFEKQPDAGRGAWVGTQNAGKPVFERSKERPHTGQIAAKVTCRTGDVYARWVYQAPDLFARVKRCDRLRLSFWYRASADLGDALVQVNHDAGHGWRQYTLKRLQATGEKWLLYEAVLTVDVHPNGSGEVQLRGTTDRTGEQVAYFDDVSLEVVGHEELPELRPDVVLLGDVPNGLTGTYHSDGRIVFAGKPVQECEFTATGTGVTGLTVNFPDEMVVQVNHSAAIDEGGKLRALGRLHLDLEGRPFANAGHFRMEHDLRRSVITAIAETPDGPVKVEIRAHVPHDAIRIDVDDGRKTPSPVTVRVEEDGVSKDAHSPEHGLRLWHENPTAGGTLQEAMASDLEGSVFRGLSGRAFGLTVFPGPDKGAVSGRTMTLPGAKRHTLYVVGASAPGGSQALAEALAQSLARARGAGDDGFRETHAAWWDAFWRRSQVVISDPTGRMLRYQAAFDLYRYYLACCAGERRETPVRFQIDLFRYHRRVYDWTELLLCAVEQYQSFYGALRAGDGETWQGVRDPSEMVCALRDALPRLIALGRAQACKKELIEQWEQMLASLPNVPLGKFRYQGADVKPEILPGDQLVPAADMSGCEAYKLPWSGEFCPVPIVSKSRRIPPSK